MSLISASLVRICIVLVALPMSPCALVSPACSTAAGVDPKPAAAKSCCAHRHDSPAPVSRPYRPAPCDRECCKLHGVAPIVPKMVVADFSVVPPLLFDTAFDIAAAFTEAPLAAVVFPGVSPRILHCVWRC